MAWSMSLSEENQNRPSEEGRSERRWADSIANEKGFVRSTAATSDQKMLWVCVQCSEVFVCDVSLGTPESLQKLLGVSIIYASPAALSPY